VRNFDDELQIAPDNWLLKGGLVLQLRLSQHARTTKDMDLLSLANRDEMPPILTHAALFDLQDWFSFTVRSVTAALPGPGLGGLRFFVTAQVAGRTFESFHIDVGSGDPVIEPAEMLETPSLLAFAGMGILIVRRLSRAKLRAVTTAMDWVVLALLLIQVFLGLWTAFFFRWGAAWFIHTATPWVQSLATFRPQTETIVALPWVPKLHFLNATLLIAVLPFSRLVHLLAFPIAYLWRRLQVVIWNRLPAR